MSVLPRCFAFIGLKFTDPNSIQDLEYSEWLHGNFPRVLVWSKERQDLLGKVKSFIRKV